MIRWIPYAFVRITLFFILGICLGIYYPDIFNFHHTLFIFLGLVFLYACMAVCTRQAKFFKFVGRIKFLAGLIGLSAVFIAGYVNVLYNTDTRKSGHLLHIKSPVEYYKVVLTSAPEEKKNSWKVEASVQTVQTGREWQACEADILLYFSKRDFPAPFGYGDVLLIKGNPQRIAAPTNPGEFDYRRFLSFKNIHHQQFVKSVAVMQIGFNPQSRLAYYAFKCREWAEATLKRNIAGEQEQGLASALVLGVKDGLDDELLSAYKATGAMHVLAVSGLHVGILYGLLLFLLKPLYRFRAGPWLFAGISILVLWGYAFITGLSPSVLRAVTMFSFVALAKPAGYRTNIYNILAASAFCILWYDPFLLMTVGFQLSYLAVLGIVYMQSGLYNLWEPTSRFLDEIWKVTSISVAAQLATFALGLYYFHQFPNYFLLSNLFVIPGAFSILVMGILLLAVGLFQPVASALGFLLGWVIKVLNAVIFAIEDIPFSLIENIYITTLQCWLLLGMLVVMLLLIQTRRFIWVTVTFFLGILFSLAQWHHFQQDINIQKVVIYDVGGYSAIDLVDRGQVYFIADSALQKDAGKIDFHIKPHRVKTGGIKIHTANDFQQKLSGCSLFVWKGKSFLRIYDPAFFIPQGVHVDYVIASQNAVKDPHKLFEQIQMERLILDSSNSRYLTTKLLEQNNTAQHKIHSVLHQGAFELTI
jgi:competence protein ComEC